MTWTLDLPDGEYLTPNSRAHWAKRQRCARAWREATAWLARAERIPRLDRVNVQLVMIPKDRRRRDEDNLTLVQKWCIDGLVDAAVVPDDAPQHVRAEMPRIWTPDVELEAHRWVLYVEQEAADAA